MATEAEKALERLREAQKLARVAEETKRLESFPIPCCGTMAHQLIEQNLFDVLTNEPFETTPAPPMVYAISDGGHGGMVPIQFCPFCGIRFTWEAR